MLLRNILAMFIPWQEIYWTFITNDNLGRHQEAIQSPDYKFFTGHLVYTPETCVLMRDFRLILNIRDPYSYVLSNARFFYSQPKYKDSVLARYIQDHGVSFDDVVPLVINGSRFRGEVVPKVVDIYVDGNSGFVVGERGFGPATALDTVDAPILKPSAFGRGWDLGACVNGGVEGRAGDAPLPPKWLITMGLRQKNRFNECKACGCEPASNHMSGFGFSATDSDSGRRAHGSHERARSARKGRKKHVSVLPRPNRSPWIVVEQNHNGIGKLMVPAFQIYANMNVINDL